MKKFFLRLFIAIGACFLFQHCNTTSTDYNKGYKEGYQDGYKDASEGKQAADPTTPPVKDPNYTPPTDDGNDKKRDAYIPDKVYTTLDYIKKNNRAPDGYVGGRHFGNYEHVLPERDAAGNTIDYQEWDVNPKVEGKNRGTQRLVTGSDGRAWYTSDHYKSFAEVKK